MARITVEDCLEKVENQYDLVLLAKERTSQLNSGSEMLVEEDNDKRTVVALREIAEGKVDVDELKKSTVLRLRKEPDESLQEQEAEEISSDDFEKQYKGEVSKGLSAAIGTISGFCSGIASLGGPPVVMFLIAKGSNASQTRAGIIAYFAFATVLRLTTFGICGLLSLDALYLSLLLAPVYMSGIWVGNRNFKGISENGFRRFVVALVLVMGMIALIN